MAVFNVFFEIGTGYWDRGESNTDIFIKRVLVLMILSIGGFSAAFGAARFTRKKLKMVLLAFLFLSGYWLTEFLFASGRVTSELLRLTSYVSAFIVTISVVRLVDKKILINVSKYIWIILVTYLLSSILSGSLGRGRLGSEYIDANYFGAILILGLAYPYYNLKCGSKTSWRTTLSIPILVFGVIATGSSGALLNMIIVTYVFFSRGLIAKLAIWSPVLLVLFLVIVNNSISLDIRSARLLDSGSETYELSVGTRLNQYNRLGAALLNGELNPWFGIGGSNIKAVIGQELHNSILRPYLAGGIISLFSWLSLIIVFLRLQVVSTEFNILRALFVGWLFHSLTLPQETLPLFWFLFTLMSISYEENSIDRF